MSYELFEKAAAINDEFETIPTKTSLLAKGIIVNSSGHIEYKGNTYLTNLVKVQDLPFEIRGLFIDKKLPANNKGRDIETKIEDDKFKDLNKILFEQLQNIVDPEAGTDINRELKKANAVCNVADKMISIAGLSLKAEIFAYKKRFPNGKSLYQD